MRLLDRADGDGVALFGHGFLDGRIVEGCTLIAYKPTGAPNWALADGKYVQGLHNRRKAEMTLCLKGLT